MGVFGSKPIVKKGEAYEKYKSKIRPFDIILFSGDDFISDLIKYMEKHRMEKIEPSSIPPGSFSHSGMIVTSEILDHPHVHPGKLYILESTMSGRLGGGVYDIEGRSVFGVQLRDFDQVLSTYDVSDHTAVAHVRLANNPLDNPEIVSPKKRFSLAFEKFKGRPYDLQLLDQIASVFPSLRFLRDLIDDKTKNDQVFCSQLVADIYIWMGLLSTSINSKDITPMDFAGFATRKSNTKIPVELLDEPVYIVSDMHIE